MTEALEYAVLAAHLTSESDPATSAAGGTVDAARPATDVPGATPAESWFDAVDVALRSSDGRVTAFGIRCAAYVMSPDDPNRAWGAYVPLAVTLDLAAVHHWDFNEVMWLGPSPRPCVVWSNAERLAVRSLDVLFAEGRRDGLLSGPDGLGLPTLDDVGLTLPPGTVFHRAGLSPLLSHTASRPGDDDL